jgi:hypothetical protein
MSPTQPIAAWLFLPSNLMISRENPAKNPSMGPVVSFHWTNKAKKILRKFTVWEKSAKVYHLSYSSLMQLQVGL